MPYRRTDSQIVTYLFNRLARNLVESIGKFVPQFVAQSLTDVSASGHRWFLADPRAVETHSQVTYWARSRNII